MDLTVFDQLTQANAAYASGGRHRDVSVRPARQLAVLTCMDARIDVFAALGLEVGDAHVIRNAGGRVTEDALRSLTLSAALLGVRSLVQITHTDCGVRDPEGDIGTRLLDAMGRTPQRQDWHTFDDPRGALQSDAALLANWPNRPDAFGLAGYVFDVTTGVLEEVVAPHAVPAP